ncbi:hypothetical protein [Jiella sp. M17.18]|uniref:hypothetical protein n=1 Tax=Jiella sp. M17.18 TaxID=3234247 RepID=UPI0034DDFFD4
MASGIEAAMGSVRKHLRPVCRSLAAVVILLGLLISTTGTAATGGGSRQAIEHCVTAGTDLAVMRAMPHMAAPSQRHTRLASHGTMDGTCAAQCLTAVPAAGLRVDFLPLSRDIVFSITASEGDGVSGPAVERPPRA